tara:strand:- start:148 stop:1812 length:1665 start_codon:yes stop_codon:yes gene_type:complete
MGIKRYIADKDNTITNAFERNLIIRGTGSNMGASDILEVFSIYGQTCVSSSSESGLGGSGISRSQELSRILIQFPVSNILADRTAGSIPPSGSVNFYLRLYNAKHSSTVPKGMTLTVVPVSSSWEEGFGLDMENYQDLTENQEGSNWMMRGSSAPWATVGGTYLTSSVNNDFGDRSQTITFENGVGNLKLDITDTVERWIKGVLPDGFPNYGLGIHLTASQEAYYSSSLGGFANGSIIQNVAGATRSWYTKMFFARTSEFFFRRPSIEARWDSSIKDNRGNMQYSSSLLSATDNLNTLYLYNYVDGQLKNIPNLTDKSAEIYVQLFSGSLNNSKPSGSAIDLVTTTDYVDTAIPTVVTGGWVSTGIYSASFALTAAASPVTKMFDVWQLDGGSQLGAQVFTGSFEPKVFKSSTSNVPRNYVVNISNLKPQYHPAEISRFKVLTRLKDWSPTIYTKAVAKVENTIIDNMYFKVTRVIDDLDVISFGTGSSTPESVGSNTSYTRLSYDASGSYFDLDMSMLEPGYMYGIKLAYFKEPSYKQFNQTFKFRVEKTEDS